MAEHTDSSGELLEIGRKGGYTAREPFDFNKLPQGIQQVASQQTPEIANQQMPASVSDPQLVEARSQSSQANQKVSHG